MGQQGREGRGGREARRGPPGGDWRGTPARTSPAGIIAEAERSLEMGERKQRARELPKARALLEASRTKVAAAGLASDRAGCLIFAAASTALLEVEQDEARAAAFGAPPNASALGADRRRRVGVLLEVRAALDAGASAAAAARASADELSHLAETMGTVQLLLSEAHEELEDGPAALVCARSAVASFERAADLHARAAQAVADEMRGQAPVAAEPSIELLRALAPALMAFGKLALQAARAPREDGGDDAACERLRAEGEASVERSLAALEEACSLCDSERGDDLPAAVEEWARLLWEASALAPPSGRAQVLSRAAAKCRQSLGLVSVPLASTRVLLGDVLRAAAEEAAAPLHAALASDAPPVASRAPLSAADAAACTREALVLYALALRDGYGSALAISRTDMAAQLGAADARVDCARLVSKLPAAIVRAALPAAGDACDEHILVVADAAACLGAAAAGYAALGARPLADWLRAGLSAEEHADFQFNWACAAALQGDEATAQQLLAALVREGRIESEAELSGDEDLRPFAQTDWMQQLRMALRARGV
ncbi:hypothetical protein KFE25_007641 [Diacronema lutheri]|uniref:Uncharacterized protein n=1 Tax=Diacronema lutheri TaxID=2081491 RepID=A0A8J5XPI9_DIALT|nr:hypothetical protein KFE25_007641 [Diacronema lutheri]